MAGVCSASLRGRPTCAARATRLTRRRTRLSSTARISDEILAPGRCASGAVNPTQMRKMLVRYFFTGALLAGSIIVLRAAAPELPPFQEVFDTVRTNAGGLSESELNAAAVEGLISKLGSRAWLIDSSKNSTAET